MSKHNLFLRTISNVMFVSTPPPCLFKLHACYVPQPSYSHWFGRSSNI